MATHNTLDLTAFTSTFPAFANQAQYPPAMINTFYAAAGNYIDQNDNWSGMNGSMLDWALQLLTCHLLVLLGQMTAGQQTGFLTSSSISDVTNTFLAPVARDGWEFWLTQTPYGNQLWALLDVQSAGGWSVGGGPETWALRKAGGFF